MKTGVILAAGIGSRLRPLTADKPKCMVSVAGRPILDYQLTAYEEAGFDRVYVIGGFCADAIKLWLSKRRNRVSVKFVENADFDTTNNMYSLSLLSKQLRGQPFYLSNGDVVFNSALLKKVTETDESKSCISIDKSVFMEESMKITLSPKGVIRGIAKSYAKDEAFAVSIDLYRFSANGSEKLFDIVEDYISKRGETHHWTEVALHKILQTESHDFIAADISGHNWVEVDNLADLAQADILFSPHFNKIKNAGAFILDTDGTLALDGKPIPGATETVKRMQKDRVVVFCTNNSSRAIAEHAELIKSLGMTCYIDDVVSSIGVTIDFLRERRIKSLFVVGTPSLITELETAGFKHDEENPEIIVVGFDKTLNFKNVSTASRLISKGCPYILTHPDVACPTACGPIPDAGSIRALLETSTGVSPIAMLGKPSREMIAPLLKKHSLEPEQVVVVGDRLTTDVLMAENSGCMSVLVLSGATSRLEADRSDIIPSMIVDDINKLLEVIGR